MHSVVDWGRILSLGVPPHLPSTVKWGSILFCCPPPLPFGGVRPLERRTNELIQLWRSVSAAAAAVAGLPMSGSCQGIGMGHAEGLSNGALE